MANNNEHILKVADGKETRAFLLNDEEFEYFLMRFEENELINVDEFSALQKVDFSKLPSPNIRTI